MLWLCFFEEQMRYSYMVNSVVRRSPYCTMICILFAASDVSAAGSLPQLDVTTYSSQIFWLVIAFLLLFVFLTRYSIPRIGSLLEARQDRMVADIESSEALKQKAEVARTKYRSIVDDFNKEMLGIHSSYEHELEKYREEVKEATSIKIESMVRRNVEEMELLRKELEGSLQEVSEDVLKDILSKVLPEIDGYTHDDIKLAVRDVINEERIKQKVL